ncbi:MAG: hypothetical protein AAFP77_19000 [Bacteroidota bacterium]
MKRILKYIGLSILGLILLGVIAGFFANQPLPTGEAGPAADALARKMETAVNKMAWDSTRFVSWKFRTGTAYMWDKDRQAVVVEWGNNKVLLRTTDQSGKVFVDGKEVTATEEKQKMLAKAWSQFANDSFWLCAPMKAFNPGTSREIVTLEDGKQGLLVSYSSGGVTPGDAYLWHLDESGLPVSWQMWVKIIPVGGLSFTWENWTDAPQPRIATEHNGSLLSVPIIDLEFLTFSDSNNPLRSLWSGN